MLSVSDFQTRSKVIKRSPDSYMRQKLARFFQDSCCYRLCESSGYDAEIVRVSRTFDGRYYNICRDGAEDEPFQSMSDHMAAIISHHGLQDMVIAL